VELQYGHKGLCIFELLDSKPDFAERDFGGEKQFARLSGDELRDGSSRFGLQSFDMTLVSRSQPLTAVCPVPGT
jgi:hypothetical protein